MENISIHSNYFQKYSIGNWFYFLNNFVHFILWSQMKFQFIHKWVTMIHEFFFVFVINIFIKINYFWQCRLEREKYFKIGTIFSKRPFSLLSYLFCRILFNSSNMASYTSITLMDWKKWINALLCWIISCYYMVEYVIQYLQSPLSFSKSKISIDYLWNKLFDFVRFHLIE